MLGMIRGFVAICVILLFKSKYPSEKWPPPTTSKADEGNFSGVSSALPAWIAAFNPDRKAFYNVDREPSTLNVHPSGHFSISYFKDTEILTTCFLFDPKN